MSDAELFEELSGGQAVPFFLGLVNCTGFEQDLLDCWSDLPPPDGDCAASAAVSCEKSSGEDTHTHTHTHTQREL